MNLKKKALPNQIPPSQTVLAKKRSMLPLRQCKLMRLPLTHPTDLRRLNRMVGRNLDRSDRNLVLTRYQFDFGLVTSPGNQWTVR